MHRHCQERDNLILFQAFHLFYQCFELGKALIVVLHQAEYLHQLNLLVDRMGLLLAVIKRLDQITLLHT
jgi:hypothetical protein